VLAETANEIAELLAQGLTRRLAELKAASERLESFAFDPGDEAPDLLDEEGDSEAALRDLVLRALARAADPLNFVLIERLAAGDATVGDLAHHAGIPRAATSERINDLLQVGLVGRTHRGDGVGLTPPGRAIFDLVAAVVERGRKPS
jgi:DNA-binding MarR family transcriptional regulator